MFKKAISLIILSSLLLLPTIKVFGAEEDEEYKIYILYRDSHSIYPVTFEQVLIWAGLTGQFLPGHNGILIKPPTGEPYILKEKDGEGK